jgi:hypothetical protein
LTEKDFQEAFQKWRRQWNRCHLREGTNSRVMAANRPHSEFYDYYSVSPEYFGYTPVLYELQVCARHKNLVIVHKNDFLANLCCWWPQNILALLCKFPNVFSGFHRICLSHKYPQCKV